MKQKKRSAKELRAQIDRLHKQGMSMRHAIIKVLGGDCRQKKKPLRA